MPLSGDFEVEERSVLLAAARVMAPERTTRSQVLRSGKMMSKAIWFTPAFLLPIMDAMS